MTVGRVSPRGKTMPPAPPRRTSSFRDRKGLTSPDETDVNQSNSRLNNLPEENLSELSESDSSEMVETVTSLKPVKAPKPARSTTNIAKETRDADTQVANMEARHVKETVQKWGGTLPKGSTIKATSSSTGLVESFRRTKVNKKTQPDVVPREEPLPETESDEERQGLPTRIQFITNPFFYLIDFIRIIFQ